MEPAPNGQLWTWFVRHAQSRYALVWLALFAFADPIFLPIAPEVFVVALMLAHPKRAWTYLAVALASSLAGASVAFYFAKALFHYYGESYLSLIGAHKSFVAAQHLLHGHVFWTMLVGNFTPIPDKVLIYTAGFLGVHFVPFIIGYFVGRGMRMSIVAYLAGRYGTDVLAMLRRYVWGATVALVILGTIYAMVHWHLFGL